MASLFAFGPEKGGSFLASGFPGAGAPSSILEGEAFPSGMETRLTVPLPPRADRSANLAAWRARAVDVNVGRSLTHGLHDSCEVCSRRNALRVRSNYIAAVTLQPSNAPSIPCLVTSLRYLAPLLARISGQRAKTEVESPPRGVNSPRTTHHSGWMAATMSHRILLTAFS